MGKKLLIISQRFWPEDNDINEIAQYFAENEVKVDVLCGQAMTEQGRFMEGYKLFGHKEETFGEINVYRAPEIKKQGSLQKRPLINYISFFISSAFRIRALKKNQYDAVFIYQTSPVFMGNAGYRLARKRNIRSVMFVHDLWPDAIYKELEIRDSVLKAVFKAVSKRAYKKANRLVTSSVETQKYLVRQIADTPGRVAYVPAFSSGIYVPGKKDDRITQRFMGSFNLLYIGQIPADDSFDIFLDLAQKLIGAAVRDIRLIFVGEGEGYEDFKGLIDKRGLYDTVFAEGKVEKEKLPGYIFAADAFIYAQKSDINISYKPPKKIIDFMGCAKPVIAAADAEGKEVIRKAACGLVSDPEDTQALFENVMKIYKTPEEELKLMGQNGLAYQKENYSLSRTADKILDIIFPEEM